MLFYFAAHRRALAHTKKKKNSFTLSHRCNNTRLFLTRTLRSDKQTEGPLTCSSVHQSVRGDWQFLITSSKKCSTLARFSSLNAEIGCSSLFLNYEKLNIFGFLDNTERLKASICVIVMGIFLLFYYSPEIMYMINDNEIIISCSSYTHTFRDRQILNETRCEDVWCLCSTQTRRQISCRTKRLRWRCSIIPFVLTFPSLSLFHSHTNTKPPQGFTPLTVSSPSSRQLDRLIHSLSSSLASLRFLFLKKNQTQPHAQICLRSLSFAHKP